jgi:shikimate kinase
MVSGRLISLVGMPGAGKSTIGKILSKHFSIPYFDSDSIFEARTGVSISQYFSDHGEASFREMETTILGELTHKNGCVLSTGGGVVLSPSNREMLSSRTEVVYLQASPDTLFQRLRNDSRRPLLQGQELHKKLTKMFDARDPLYRSVARVTVTVDNRLVEDAVAEILTYFDVRDFRATGTP